MVLRQPHAQGQVGRGRHQLVTEHQHRACSLTGRPLTHNQFGRTTQECPFDGR
jgi:hypothetical protein